MAESQPDEFEELKKASVAGMAADRGLADLTRRWFIESCRHRYSYNFTWMGRPIIQYPQDIVAMQEVIWRVKPDLIVETGVAHGGSLVFYASMLTLIGGDGHAVGIDIDIRAHNRAEIEAHPMYNRITLIEGSSTSEAVVEQVRRIAAERERVLLVLDSNHTHDHVLSELMLYSPLVTKGSYVIVFDTVIENIPEVIVQGRPWGKGNNPMTAVREFLKTSDRFQVDREIEAKLVFTVAPNGFLKCVRE